MAKVRSCYSIALGHNDQFMRQSYNTRGAYNAEERSANKRAPEATTT